MSERAPHPDDAVIAALYREAAGEAPPPALDAAVLREARQAVTGASREPRARWWMPWRVPFAFAAVAVLSISVALIVEREGGAPLELHESPTPPAASEAQPAPSETEPTPPRPAVPGESLREKRTDAAQEGTRFSGSDARQARVPAAPPENSESRESGLPLRTQARAAREADVRNRADEARSPAAAPEKKAESSAPSPAAAGGEPSAEAPPPAVPARAEPAARPPIQAPRPAPAPAMKPYGAPRALSVPAAAGEAMAPAVATLIAALDKRPPAEWRARIAALRGDGRDADAEALAAEFRRRFPEEPLSAPGPTE